MDRSIRGSGLSLAGLGTLAVETAPRLWERYQQERERVIVPAAHKPDPKKWPDTGLHAAWIGHSTVLMKIEGVTVVTDPVFSDRVGLGIGPVTFGLKRIIAPALTQKETPRPDIVLLSHAHMDHFDLPSLRALESGGTNVVTASKTSDLLRSRYRTIHELAWGDEVRFGAVTIRAFQVNHWGARMRSDTYRGFNGYAIETPRYRVLFGGDTAMTDSFLKLRDSRGFDLAIMPIGAYNPWVRAHCTPEQALRMAEDAGAKVVLPVHHRTFQLSSEPYDEPMDRLLEAVRGDLGRLALQAIGAEFHAE